MQLLLQLNKLSLHSYSLAFFILGSHVTNDRRWRHSNVISTTTCGFRLQDTDCFNLERACSQRSKPEISHPLCSCYPRAITTWSSVAIRRCAMGSSAWGSDRSSHCWMTSTTGAGNTAGWSNRWWYGAGHRRSWLLNRRDEWTAPRTTGTASARLASPAKHSECHRCDSSAAVILHEARPGALTPQAIRQLHVPLLPWQGICGDIGRPPVPGQCQLCISTG